MTELRRYSQKLIGWPAPPAATAAAPVCQPKTRLNESSEKPTGNGSEGWVSRSPLDDSAVRMIQ
ncbi:hypothetical protein [Microlunatus sp. Gsoil 973]|uniref:hypothetical protein n=1 Tax=Microlunatus sp. Gsoil 973 TaxID=2672569 RepID=UPI001E620713|nr:hypothetical protein [Microlunatus sp. Gsoil 973]